MKKGTFLLGSVGIVLLAILYHLFFIINKNFFLIFDNAPHMQCIKNLASQNTLLYIHSVVKSLIFKDNLDLFSLQKSDSHIIACLLCLFYFNRTKTNGVVDLQNLAKNLMDELNCRCYLLIVFKIPSMLTISGIAYESFSIFTRKK